MDRPADPDPESATRILSRAARGNQDAEAELMALVYDRLRGLAARYLQGERPGHTLQATEDFRKSVT